MLYCLKYSFLTIIQFFYDIFYDILSIISTYRDIVIFGLSLYCGFEGEGDGGDGVVAFNGGAYVTEVFENELASQDILRQVGFYGLRNLFIYSCVYLITCMTLLRMSLKSYGFVNQVVVQKCQ